MGKGSREGWRKLAIRSDCIDTDTRHYHSTTFQSLKEGRERPGLAGGNGMT